MPKETIEEMVDRIWNRAVKETPQPPKMQAILICPACDYPLPDLTWERVVSCAKCGQKISVLY